MWTITYMESRSSGMVRAQDQEAVFDKMRRLFSERKTEIFVSGPRQSIETIESAMLPASAFTERSALKFQAR
jgi:hypothetical protein